MPATLGIVRSGAALAVVPGVMLDPDIPDVALLRFDPAIRTTIAAYERHGAPQPATSLFISELRRAAVGVQNTILDPVHQAVSSAVSFDRRVSVGLRA
jgi:DNA-binding transcriptional LysR family regulator